MKTKIFAFLLLFSTQTLAFDFNVNNLDVTRLFEDEKEFNVRNSERLFALIDVLYLDKNGVLQAHYHNYDFDMLYRGKNIFSRPFDNHIYEIFIQESYSRSWHQFIIKYDSLGKTVKLLLAQYKEIAQRLTTAYENKNALQEKYHAYYADEKYLLPIENDIKDLSQLGWQLTQVTHRFHDAIRPLLVNRELAKDREKAHLDIVSGLNNFNQRIEFAEHHTQQIVGGAIENTIMNISNAVDELELNNP